MEVEETLEVQAMEVEGALEVELEVEEAKDPFPQNLSHMLLDHKSLAHINHP